MPSGYRPIYEDSSVTFIPETNSSFTSSISSVSKFIYCGGPVFSIFLNPSLTTQTGIIIQGNNSNLIDPSGTGVSWSVNPLLNRNTAKTQVGYSPSFTANWVNIGTIPAGSLTAVVSNMPVRYVRLVGPSISAGFVAYLWTDGMTVGN